MTHFLHEGKGAPLKIEYRQLKGEDRGGGHLSELVRGIYKNAERAPLRKRRDSRNSDSQSH